MSAERSSVGIGVDVPTLANFLQALAPDVHGVVEQLLDHFDGIGVRRLVCHLGLLTTVTGHGDPHREL